MQTELDLVTHAGEIWPALPEAAWGDTRDTLQLWMQIVGKVRLALMPPVNHTWSVTLYPTVRGVSTSPMPHGTRMLEIEFDFIDHVLLLRVSDGGCVTLPLKPMTVASFYQQFMAALNHLQTPVQIWHMPVEIANPIPFDADHTHKSYDPEYAHRFWLALLQTTRVFMTFRARFTGKVSQIHLFWGALDLACTRFSGRPAPEHPSMPGLCDRVVHDAYSHEVSSCGFWPGATGIEPFFYSYAYPEPPGYAETSITPAKGGFNKDFGEFILPYEEVRTSADPDATLLQFLQSTYEAAANCAHWDRTALEALP